MPTREERASYATATRCLRPVLRAPAQAKPRPSIIHHPRCRNHAAVVPRHGTGDDEGAAGWRTEKRGASGTNKRPRMGIENHPGPDSAPSSLIHWNPPRSMGKKQRKQRKPKPKGQGQRAAELGGFAPTSHLTPSHQHASTLPVPGPYPDRIELLPSLSYPYPYPSINTNPSSQQSEHFASAL